MNSTAMKFLTLLFFLSFTLGMTAQDIKFTCGTDHEMAGHTEKPAGPITKPGVDSKPVKPSPPTTTTCADDEITYLRINIHYIQRPEPYSEANFTTTGDGYSPPKIPGYTGYSHATDLINSMNDNLVKNYQATVWPGMNDSPQSSPPAMEHKLIQYVLKGVHFQRASTLQEYNSYGSPSTIMNAFGENIDSELNLFVMKNSQTGVGQAWSTGIYLGGARKRYAQLAPNLLHQAINEYARIANHELGHILGLDHAFDCNDPCAGIDIDPDLEATDNAPIDPNSNCPAACGNGCWESGSLNLMAYVPVAGTLTPCQLDIVYDQLQNYGDYVESCCSDYTTSTITLGSSNHPGIRFHPNCEISEPCDFMIIRNTVDQCVQFRDDDDQINRSVTQAQTFCFDLLNAGLGQTCNTWTVNQIHPDNGDILHTQTFSNVEDIYFAPNFVPVWPTDIEVCVTLCDAVGCVVQTKCELFQPPNWTFTDDPQEFRFSGETTAGERIFENETLTLFPNPASSHLQLNYSGTQIGQLQILDSQGKLLLQPSPEQAIQNGINIESLTPGVYFLKVMTVSGQLNSQYFIKL